jgi:hypothetical protein
LLIVVGTLLIFVVEFVVEFVYVNDEIGEFIVDDVDAEGEEVVFVFVVFIFEGMNGD